MSSASDFVIENGVLVAYNGSDSHMVIPEGVTAIAPELLRGKSNVTSVTIPPSVTEIGRDAFCGKWHLASYSECFIQPIPVRRRTARQHMEGRVDGQSRHPWSGFHGGVAAGRFLLLPGRGPDGEGGRNILCPHR